MPKDVDGSRQAANCAEALARAAAWPPGSGIIAHAERVAAKQMRPQQQAVIWAAAALRAERIDEATLLAVGLPRQIIRYAAEVVEGKNESAGQYADRVTASEWHDVLAAARDKVADAVNGTPIRARGEGAHGRLNATGRIENARREREGEQPGDEPPPGGIVDDRTTAPGLRQATRRLGHYASRASESLTEMQTGPGGKPWGFVERLDLQDLASVIRTGRYLTMLTAAIMIELSMGTESPTTPEQRAAIAATGSMQINDLTAIAQVCEMTATIARRIAPEEPAESEGQTTH